MASDGWRARVRRALQGVRTRILLCYLVLFAVSLSVSTLVLRQVLLARLDEGLADALAQEVDELRLLAGGTNPGTGQPFGDDVSAIFDTFVARNAPGPGEAVFTIVDGEAGTGSPGAPAPLVDDPDLARSWAALDAPTWGSAASDAGPVRWLAVPVRAPGQPDGVFVAASFYGPQRAEIDQAVRVMGAVSATVLVVGGIVGWVMARRVTAPVRTLTTTARHIGENDLTARIPIQGDDELSELTSTFNDMVERLEQSISTQRRFLNDISHELRTPITILRGHLELLPEEAAERDETLALCLDELDRMSRYVGDLAVLARAEQPDFLRRRAVDLAALTTGIETRARTLEPQRSWVVESRASATVLADSDRLTQAWLNLVTNAAQHTEPGSEILLGSAVDREQVSIWVRDHGPGVEASERARIFERLGRGGDTRTRRPDGTGLGLAIVAAIARAHGGTVDLDSEPGLGATFTICFTAETTEEGSLR